MADNDNQSKPASSSGNDGGQPARPVFPSNSQTREGDQPHRPITPSRPIFPENSATKSERWNPARPRR
jgi:hypothetical protein